MLRVCTSSMVVQLSIGGVSLILTDVQFGSFSENLVTNVHNSLFIMVQNEKNILEKANPMVH